MHQKKQHEKHLWQHINNKQSKNKMNSASLEIRILFLFEDS